MRLAVAILYVCFIVYVVVSSVLVAINLILRSARKRARIKRLIKAGGTLTFEELQNSISPDCAVVYIPHGRLGLSPHSGIA